MNTRELAKMLNVSQTTVVLALRNDRSISEETRKRIQQAAERAGYTRNPLVSALMAHVSRGRSGRSRGEVIGVLTAADTKDGWRSYPGLNERMAELHAYARKIGFRMEHFWLGARGAQAASVAKVLRTRGVRGSVLLMSPHDIEHLDIDWEHHPVSALGHIFLCKPVNQACDNHFEGVKICYRQLRALGYRRIALVLPPGNDIQTRYRWTGGFSICPRLFGGEEILFEPLLWPDDETPREPFLKWYRKTRPDAIISIFPDFPLRWLEAEGILAPRDFGYATLDLPVEKIGKIAGLRENHRAVSAALIDLVVEQLNANFYGLPESPKLVEIEGHWIPGDSACAQG